MGEIWNLHIGTENFSVKDIYVNNAEKYQYNKKLHIKTIKKSDKNANQLSLFDPRDSFMGSK